MDPKACLLAAFDAIGRRDFDELADHLGNYRSWRNGGGFQPKIDGDAVARLFDALIAADQWGDAALEELEDRRREIERLRGLVQSWEKSARPG